MVIATAFTTSRPLATTRAEPGADSRDMRTASGASRGAAPRPRSGAAVSPRNARTVEQLVDQRRKQRSPGAPPFEKFAAAEFEKLEAALIIFAGELPCEALCEPRHLLQGALRIT